ncbi:MAG: antibiotic biosynthesis monooxygenase [Terriglobales bacterium]
MYTRVVEITAKPGKARELCSTINDKVLPMLRKHTGFVDETILISDQNPSMVLGISTWKTREDAERYNREDYPKVTDTIRNLCETTPTVRTFDVDTSTTHRVASGKAA